ncbi:hypothetical protein ACINB_31740 [Acidovorax sp. NB1]|nr:hypothetical protein ACINB_31740 [Acidovorax sp. NB1]
MAAVPERVGVGPPDWHAADKAYQLHHLNCPTCIAAGMAPGKRERCPDGAALWATYQQAGDPPHFTWLRKRPTGRKT